MPQPRVKPKSTHCFEDADHAPDKITRRSKTGILIFCNQAPVIWQSKKQNSAETSNFGSKLTAIKLAVGLVIASRYKLRMFGVPLEGRTYILCNNEAVFKNTSTPDYVLHKKNHSIT